METWAHGKVSQSEKQQREWCLSVCKTARTTNTAGVTSTAAAAKHSIFRLYMPLTAKIAEIILWILQYTQNICNLAAGKHEWKIGFLEKFAKFPSIWTAFLFGLISNQLNQHIQRFVSIRNDLRMTKTILTPTPSAPLPVQHSNVAQNNLRLPWLQDNPIFTNFDSQRTNKGRQMYLPQFCLFTQFWYLNDKRTRRQQLMFVYQKLLSFGCFWNYFECVGVRCAAETDNGKIGIDRQIQNHWNPTT